MANQCNKALVLPRTSAESVRQCCRNEGRPFDCTTFTTQRTLSTNHLGPVPASSARAQAGDPIVQGDPMVWHILMTAPPDQVSRWLLMNKVVLDPLGAASGSTGSGIPAQISVNVQHKCSLKKSVDLDFQHLCYAASQCQVARCIVQNQLSLVEGAWLIRNDAVNS